MRTLLNVFAVTVLCACANQAHAHFIWLTTAAAENGRMSVQVHFSEKADDDDSTYLDRLQEIKLKRLSRSKSFVDVSLTRTDEALSAKVAKKPGKPIFIATHDWGVVERGETAFRLAYYAKGGPFISNKAWQQQEAAAALRLDIVPEFDGDQLTVTVRFDGAPISGAQVTVSGAGLEDEKIETDEQGRATLTTTQAGLCSIRARHIEAVGGELQGKKYAETRHYSTAAVKLPTPAAPIAYTQIGTIPQTVTSFGATVLHDQLYLYGGHTGGAHEYRDKSQEKTLRRMNLKTGKWEALVEGPRLQGLALVSDGKNVYRLGGFTAKNAPDAEDDLWSQNCAAMFKPTADAWSELPPLPEPRSSFDAAVVDRTIYVIGGWSMQGAGNTHWHETAWKLDLKQTELSWQPVPAPPFQRRALALAAHQGKLYAIGGMEKEGGPTRKVSVFDIQSGQWSDGPVLIGEDGLTGFGTSAFATGGRLYATTIHGLLLRLAEDQAAWEVVGKMPTARFFHRLLPFDENRLIVVGGASMETGKFEAVELISVEPKPNKVVRGNPPEVSAGEE